MKLSWVIWNAYARVKEENPFFEVESKEAAKDAGMKLSDWLARALDDWLDETVRGSDKFQKLDFRFDLADQFDIATSLLHKSKEQILTDAISAKIAEWMMHKDTK